MNITILISADKIRTWPRDFLTLPMYWNTSWKQRHSDKEALGPFMKQQMKQVQIQFNFQDKNLVDLSILFLIRERHILSPRLKLLNFYFLDFIFKCPNLFLISGILFKTSKIRLMKLKLWICFFLYCYWYWGNFYLLTVR